MRNGGHLPFLTKIECSPGTPVFGQVYLQLRSSILSQTLRPGTKLPSTREPAEELSISRSVVVLAYEQLLAEGCVNGKVGSGTYVASELAELAGARIVKVRKCAAGTARPRPRGAADVPELSHERPVNLRRT